MFLIQKSFFLDVPRLASIIGARCSESTSFAWAIVLSTESKDSVYGSFLIQRIFHLVAPPQCLLIYKIPYTTIILNQRNSLYSFSLPINSGRIIVRNRRGGVMIILAILSLSLFMLLPHALICQDFTGPRSSKIIRP